MAKFFKRGRKFGVFGTPGRGFYINPSRRGPAVPGEGKKGGFRPSWAGGWKRASGRPSGAPRDPGTPGPLAGTAGPRREGLM